MKWIMKVFRPILVFMGVFIISYYAKIDNLGFGIVVSLSFCIGFLLSQSAKDIEEWYNNKLGSVNKK